MVTSHENCSQQLQQLSANFLFLLAARGEDLPGRLKVEDAFEGRVGIPAAGRNELGTALHFFSGRSVNLGRESGTWLD